MNKLYINKNYMESRNRRTRRKTRITRRKVKTMYEETIRKRNGMKEKTEKVYKQRE